MPRVKGLRADLMRELVLIDRRVQVSGEVGQPVRLHHMPEVGQEAYEAACGHCSRSLEIKLPAQKYENEEKDGNCSNGPATHSLIIGFS